MIKKNKLKECWKDFFITVFIMIPIIILLFLLIHKMDCDFIEKCVAQGNDYDYCLKNK